MENSFLPITKTDLEKRGWDDIDFLLVTGDAYVDHPSFGHAVISRVLESAGFRVGIIVQPDWRSLRDFTALGRPKLGVMVTSGNIDSMVCHYTAGKKKRNDDFYSPAGKAGLRPDRAVIVYTNKIREAYGDIPVIIGGIEASLRRFAHYDYWDDKVRRSVLIDSGADLLVYGMGENQTLAIAKALKAGTPVNQIRDVEGTVFYSSGVEGMEDGIFCPSFEAVSSSKKDYCKTFMTQYNNQDPITGKRLIQPHDKGFIVQNKPMPPLNRKDFDKLYTLPFAYAYHPVYEALGGVPAIEEVQFSIISSRGCFGSCSFCALSFHQGRHITSRSHSSITREAEKITKLKGFKGYIHDVGGPTANFRNAACEKQKKVGACQNKQCLFPSPCENLNISHTEYLELLRKIRKLPGIKRVFIRSGIRYDYLIQDKNDAFFKELCMHHISGQLKIAPEHISDKVLALMGKPSKNVYKKFINKFTKINKEIGKEQYIVPYLMSSHPGSTLKEAIELAVFLKGTGYSPEQVQDFYPTPGTLSTCMFYTGLDPRTMEKVYVPRSYEEKRMQRALLQFKRPENHELVKKALLKAGRADLIGFSPECLIRPSNKIYGGKKDVNKNIGRENGIGKNKRNTQRGSGGSERKGNKSRFGRGNRGR